MAERQGLYNPLWFSWKDVHMAWVFLEVALAFGIAIGIVWWTFPKKKRPQDVAAAAQNAESGAGGEAQSGSKPGSDAN